MASANATRRGITYIPAAFEVVRNPQRCIG